MPASAAQERILQSMHRAQLRSQLAAWDQVSNSAFRIRVGDSASTLFDERGWSLADRRISFRELSRKLWHIAPGALILGLPLLRPFEPFRSHLPAIIATVTIGLVLISWHYAAAMKRPGESGWGTSVLAFAATALVPLLAYPTHCEVSLMAIVILSLGDGAAALAGQTFACLPLPWNRRKTLAGTLAFVLCAAPAAAFVYWANCDAHVSFPVAICGALMATVVAALVESVPSAINDNIRVGSLAAVSAIMMHWWLGPDNF
jgi:farnesol kinase